jgi:hypothetical protein
VGEGSVDPNEDGTELLPGEDPSQASAEDAKHWAQVYQELVTVVDNLLADVRHSTSVDMAALSNQRAHYVRRLAWWRARLNG